MSLSPPNAGDGAPEDAPRTDHVAARAWRFGAQQRLRIAAVSLVVLVVVVGALVLTSGSGTSYTVNARFPDGGQLVKGGLVEVAGVKIGSIKKISLVDGQANVEMKITDERFVPFRSGTRATIRSVGQATLTNRYVAINPAPDNLPPLRDGSVLASADTAGIVDLDAILSSVDPKTRSNLRGLFANGASIYSGSGAPTFNRMLAKLNPAAAQVNEFLGEAADDRRSIERLVKSGASAARTVATRAPQLQGAVRDSATAFRAIADQRTALASALTRAPSVLRQASGTLDNAASTASALRPTLRAIPASQAQLRLVLRRAPKGLTRLAPVVDRTSRLLPPVRRTLRGLPALEKPATEGARAVGKGLYDAEPILEGLRVYGSDFFLGVINGLVSLAAGQHNVQGHYLKVEFVQSLQSLVGGALSTLLPNLTTMTGGLVPTQFNTAKNQLARCPGGATAPSQDGSSPWNPREGLCDPRQSVSPGVNKPDAICVDADNCQGDPEPKKPDLPARPPDHDGGIAAAKTASGQLKDVK